MSYPDDRYEGMLPAPPPPPRISSTMENDGPAGGNSNFTSNSNGNSSTSIYRDDYYKSRRVYEERPERKFRHDNSLDRDRRDRPSHTSGFTNDSRGYDGRDGRNGRDNRDNREIRDCRDSRGDHKDGRDGKNRFNRDLDDRSGRHRSRSRSPYKRRSRGFHTASSRPTDNNINDNSDKDYSKNRRRRSRSNSRDRRNRRRSRSSSGGETNSWGKDHRHSDRSSHDRRHSKSSVYRSKPLNFSSSGSQMANDHDIEKRSMHEMPMESKPFSESHSEYEDNSGDDIESLSKKQIHREMEERLREHLAREGKVYPPPKPQPAFVNDGSFLERFKQMQEQQQKLTESTKPPEPEIIQKPTPVPVFGKRRGGKILKTGVVQKKRPVEEPETTKGTDAWSQYLREVQQYKNVICDADGVTRCLVK